MRRAVLQSRHLSPQNIAGLYCLQVSVKRDPHMAGHYWLTDICQQAINIVSSKAGSSAVTQSNLMLKPDKLSDVGVCMCAYSSLIPA